MAKYSMACFYYVLDYGSQVRRYTQAGLIQLRLVYAVCRAHLNVYMFVSGYVLELRFLYSLEIYIGHNFQLSILWYKMIQGSNI